MKKGWKRALLWTSVGGVVAGAAVAVAKMSSRPAASPLVGQRIPSGCTRIAVWTRHFEVAYGAGQQRAQDRYLLQATGFKVWSLLESPPDRSESTTPGYTVYHVTVEQSSWALDGEGPPEQSSIVDRFYATIGVTDRARIFRREELARGGFLRLNMCRVGGAAHGVETGETHFSRAPVLNYRFEYGASAPPAGADEGALRS